MKSPFTIVLVGLLVFLAHLFSSLFSRKMIPDVLFLILIGLVLGPVIGFVSVKDFGAVGPIFTILTLIIILFQGGLELDFRILKQSLRTTLMLAIVNFVLTIAVVVGVTLVLHDYVDYAVLEKFGLEVFKHIDIKKSLLLGAIVGATSIAVVTPLVQKLKIHEKTKTILLLEAALGDVFMIVATFALLNIIESGYFHIGVTAGHLISSFIMASMIGVGAGFFWSVILNKIRIIQNPIFTTPAFVFIVYGFSEMLGFSGAIATLAFGMTLGNVELFNLPFLKSYIPHDPISLNDTEKAFISEVVFLFKTFFFIYIGISLELSHFGILFMGFILTLLIFIFRIPAIRFCVPRNLSISDASFMTIMTPKGLVTAVLASIPLQRGIEGGIFIQNVAYSIIFFSIILTSLLIFFLDKTSFSKVYRLFFSGFSDVQQEKRKTI